MAVIVPSASRTSSKRLKPSAYRYVSGAMGETERERGSPGEVLASVEEA